MGRAPEEQPVSGVDHSKPLKTAGLDVFDAVALVEYHVVIAEPGQRGKSYNPAPEKQTFGDGRRSIFFRMVFETFQTLVFRPKMRTLQNQWDVHRKKDAVSGGGRGYQSSPLFIYGSYKKKGMTK